MGWKKGSDATKLLLKDETIQDYGAVDLSGKKGKKDEVPKISLFHMFRYATALDKTLMIIGVFFAVISGSSTPIMGLFFGGMTDIFIQQSTQGLVPDDVVNQATAELLQAAFNNSVPLSLKYNESEAVPVSIVQDSRNQSAVVYEVVYQIKEFFVGNLPVSNMLPNSNASTSPPLTESEFNSKLNSYLAIYLILGTLMFLSAFIQTFCWEYASEHQVFTLRKVYFTQIMRQDISWYDKNNNDNLPNKLSDDLERVREGTGHKFVLIVQYFSTFITGIIVGLSVNWQLTLVTLCVGPFLIALTAYGAKFGASQVVREQQKYAKAGAVAEETLTNIKTVSAYSGQNIEIKKYYAALKDGCKLAMSRYNMLALCMSITFFLMYSAYGLGFWYGAKLVQEGISSPGTIFTVFFSVVVGAFSVGNALPFLNIVSAAIGVNLSIYEIISRKVTIDPYSKEGRKPFRVNGHIEFKNVSFSYPTRPSVQILKGLSLEIAPGKTAAIVGSSGAGKSTIVSLILRFYDPSSGQVCLDGVPVSELNLAWLRRQVGLVSQEPVLFGVSIGENISYGRENVTQYEIEEAAKQANAHDFIMNLPQGYDTLVGDTGSQLSGGQKQRIAIARALVRDPKILLLDEATSALDAHSEGIVQETLTSVMQGRTTVIVAHRLSTIRNVDIIYVMQDGKLFESGTHDQLMEKRSLYYELVLAQMAATDSSSGGSEESVTTSTDTESEGDEEENASKMQTKSTSVGTSSQKEEQKSEVQGSETGKLVDIEQFKKSEGKEGESSSKHKHEEHKVPWKVVDRQVSSETVQDDNDDEYETEIIHIKETREVFFDEQDVDEVDDIPPMEDMKKPTEDIGLRKRKRGSSVREITEEERKRSTLRQQESIEKSITAWELIKMHKPEWVWFTIGAFGCMAFGLVTPIFAMFYGEIFNVFTLPLDQRPAAVQFWTCMFLALAVYNALAFAVQCSGLCRAAERLIARVRAQVFENILRQPVGWFDFEASSPGVLVNRLARNAPLLKAAGGLRFSQTLSSLVTLIGALAIAFSCGWQLAVILIFSIPIIGYSSFKQAQILKKNQMRDAMQMDEAGRVASESVRNIRTVQALGQELVFTQIYERQLENPYSEGKKQALVYSFVFALMQGISLYMYALAFRYGGYLVEVGAMKTDNIYKVFFALSLCAQSIGQSFMYTQDYNKAKQAIKILNFLLTRKSEIDSSSPSGARPDIKGDVEFKNVQFVYPTRPDVRVLRGLNFKIDAGKTLALVGESGCGKSTVISLLERFYDPLSGSILVDGYDIRTVNLAHLRSKIGIVNQEPTLFDCSIKDNIAYGALAIQDHVSFQKIQDAAKVANIHDFIMSLPGRYDTMVGERGVQLSGGQKQRVAIARALIRDPKILLLDEATSALDSESEKIVQAALDLAKEGRTCIVVAHRLSTIQNADKICVVSKGKIVESGTHNELIQLKGHYYELTQRQCL